MSNSFVIERPKVTSTNTINILWMDDQPGNIDPLIQMFISQVKPTKLEFDIADSIEEAKQLIQQNRYSALIIDCQMDRLNPTGDNGAEFLLKVNQEYKYLPTFVYTAFKSDPLYESILEKSNAIKIAEKSDNFEEPIISDEFFKEIFKHVQRYCDVIDINSEDITFEAYINEPEKFQEQFSAHWKRHGTWITKELNRKGWIWGVICGDKVVQGSSDLFDYPTDKELRAIGGDFNRIPFAYSLAEEPETIIPSETVTIPWNQTVLLRDYYPTLKVRINDRELIDDFDTGAFQSQVSDEIIPATILDAFQRRANERHLGEDIDFFTKNIPIQLFTEDGSTLDSRITVRVIKNWRTGPFVKINRERKVLLGRDLLRAFPSVEIVLNTTNCFSSVRNIETQ